METVAEPGIPTAPCEIKQGRPIWRSDAGTAEFLDAIVDNVPAAIFVKDARDLRYLLVNCAAENQLGCARNALIGRTNGELLPSEEAAAYDAIDHEVLRSGRMHVGEGTFRTAHLGERIMHTCTIAVPDTGMPRYLIGISEDITERRANEARIVHVAHHPIFSNYLKIVPY